MRRFRLVAVAFASILIIVGPLYAQAVEPREKLGTAILEAIRLLEAKEYQTFLKSFAEPKDLETFTNGRPLEEFANRFGESKAQRLLGVLKTIVAQTPILEADGTKAVYQWTEPIEGKSSITFVKVDKYWYILN